jgi:hypothetical protein
MDLCSYRVLQVPEHSERIECRHPLPVVLTENSNLKLHTKYNLSEITSSEHLKCLVHNGNSFKVNALLSEILCVSTGKTFN